MRAIFDIDDTLVAAGEELDVLEEFLNDLRLDGVEIILATARPLAQLVSQSWVNRIHYVFPYNGLCLYDVRNARISNVGVIASQKEVLSDFSRVYLQPNEKVICWSEEQAAYMQKSDPKRTVQVDSSGASFDESVSIYTYCGLDSELERLKQTIDQIVRTTKVSVYEYPETRFGHARIWLEIVPYNSGKHSQLAQLNGIAGSEIFGAGNGWNDVEFLKMCTHSACPQNASEKVKDVSDTCSPHVSGLEFREHLLNLIDGTNV